MKQITLIFPSSPFLLNSNIYPPLGILYLSSFLKKHEVEVQCLDFGIGHTIDMIKYNTIGISFTTPQRKEAYEIVKKLKGNHFIAGGPHPTHMEEECIQNGFNKVIKGFGETALLEYLTGKQIILNSIDNLPYPDRNALPINKYQYYIDGIFSTPVMTSRNCIFACSFCATQQFSWNPHSAERTVNELFHIYENYGINAFMLQDDLFSVNKKRLTEIVNKICGIKFIFRGNIHTNLVHKDIIPLLKRMNVVELGLGVESGSNSILKKNLKKTTSEKNLNAINLLQDNGIRVKAFIIIGLPGENHQTIQETINWLKKAKPYDIDIASFQPYPGSAVFKNPENWGIKFDYESCSFWHKSSPEGHIPNIRTKELSAEQIIKYRNQIEEQFKKKELLR